MKTAMWNLVIIVVCYLVPAFVLRWLGGFNTAADAISKWGRASSIRRLRRAGHTPKSYVRARISS
jgi:hypothetical protein